MMNSTASAREGLVIGSGGRTARIEQVGPIGLLVGVAGLIGCIAFWMGGNGQQMFGSWIFGWYFWLTITLGMFGLSLLHHTIRPSWSVGLLRLFEAGGGPATILLMAVLFLPIVAKPDTVYEWATVKGMADPTIHKKLAYLNQTFWTCRYVFYFVVWLALSNFMKNSVKRQEANGEKRLEMGRSSWGAVGIVTFFLTVTFAIIDWVMSLEAAWNSTMYGPWQIIASALGAMSFTVVVVCLNAKKTPYTEIISPNLTKDWGNILFMFTMLWAYTAVSQFLIIWNGNLPETAQYFARRSLLFWNVVGFATIVGQFLVPWMTLLSPRVKRYPRYLAQIATWIFCVHIIDVYLAVGPALPSPVTQGGRRAPGESILFDVLAFLTVGGFWLAVYASNIRKAPLLVNYDHRLQEELANAH